MAPIGLILVTGLVLLFLLPGAVSSSIASPSAPALASSAATTRLAWFYGEPQDGTTAQTLATRNSAWVLSGHQVEDGYLATLRAAGLTGSVPGYIELPRTMGPSSCASDPNFAGYTTSWTSWDGEFCTYLNANESWFLHNSSGKRIASSGGWYYMNPASTGWRNYMVGKVGRYFTEFPGLDGIFLDDTWNTAVTARNAGCVESICQNDTAWHDATLADLQAIKAAMPAGKTLSMNSDNTSDYAGPMDGFMIEFFANGWCGTCYQSQADLEQRLSDVDAAVAAGKSVLLVGQGSATQIESMRYSHALYLMVAGPKVSYRYGEDYTQFLDYPEFSWNLGLPSGPRFKPAPTVFERDFSGGKALANVSGSSSVTLNLGGSYLLPNGSSASTVTLAAHQGMALRLPEGAPPPPDTTPPTAAFTSPGAGSAVSGSISVAANASDNVGVAGVQFKVDGNNLGSEDTSSPYSANLDTTALVNGNHTLTAVARDAAGNTASATETVDVENAPPPPPPLPVPGPVVNEHVVTKSANSVTVGWGAASGTVNGYGLARDGSMVGKTTALKYKFGHLSCGRIYVLQVWAYNQAGDGESSWLSTSTSACHHKNAIKAFAHQWLALLRH
jgi:hypothetical protein